MKSTDLTDNQLEVIADQLAPMLDYFRRMDEQGFDEGDRPSMAGIAIAAVLGFVAGAAVCPSQFGHRFACCG
jgi:hypothetical protein